MDRTAIGWALFLSVPVGVGVMLAVSQTAGRLSVLAVGAGTVVALVLFGLVVGGAYGAAPDTDERDP